MKLPALWGALFFICGIWIGREVTLPDLVLFLTAAVAFVCALIFYLKESRRFAGVAIAAALLVGGIFRVGLDRANPPDNDISRFNDLDERVTVLGEIVREPDLRPDRTYLTVGVDTLILSGRRLSVSGQVMVRLRTPTSEFNYADYVALSGYLSAPRSARNPGAFDYRDYLLTKKIRSYMSISRGASVRLLRNQTGNLFTQKLIVPLRRKLLDVFDRYLPDPQKALLEGFLIGETRFIPPELFQSFRDTGTLHLLAVSGSNVALVIGVFMTVLLCVRVPRRVVYALSLIVVLIFCNLAYNQPSVVRASIMAALVLIGKLAYRQVNYINLIAVAALMILMIDPLMLWDVGFQLSFAAVFGLVYVLPLVYRRIKFPRTLVGKVSAWLLMILLASVMAQLFVGPILAGNFNRLPLVGLVSNLVLVPLASLAVIGSVVLTVAAAIPELGQLVGQAAGLLLTLTMAAVKFFAELPVARINVAAPHWLPVLLYYAALLVGVQTLRSLRSLRHFLYLALVFANVLIWSEFAAGLDHWGRITVLDSGRYATVVVQTPDRQVLICADQAEDSSYDRVQRTLVPFLVKQKIGSVAALVGSDTAAPGYFLNTLEGEGISVGQVETAEASIRGPAESTPLKLLRANESGAELGLLVQLQSERFAILFDGCTPADLASELERLCPPGAILVLPEPDEIDGSLRAALIRLRPQAVIFSSYKHFSGEPAGFAALLEEARRAGPPIHHVRTDGAVSCSVDGRGLRIEGTVKPSD